MFEEKIEKLYEFLTYLDKKLAKQLNVQEFTNLLKVLSEKTLIDDSEAAKSVGVMIHEVYEQLSELLRKSDIDKLAVKIYKKSYGKLVVKVKEVFKLEATGSIQGQYMAMGVAIGCAIGAGLMSINPGMMSIGIAIGISLGVALGAQKEKEALDAGRLY